jgi:hypothetical protein
VNYSDTPELWSESVRLLANEVCPHISLPTGVAV